MNLPNKLTVTRLALTVVFVVVFICPVPLGETLALVLFAVASITDYFDGRIARRDKLVTNFGILMDPLADKILICSAFIAFVGRGLVPAWMAVLIVVRELAITGLRLLAAAQNVVLAAEGCGKHKTTSQIVAILSILILVSYPQWGSVAGRMFEYPLLGGPWVVWFTEASKWVAVFFTVLSGALYLQRNRALYLQNL
jgi:CDP-diacylglycerol--glycerol-3-phosphate 3-phosphatidyltransferase